MPALFPALRRRRPEVGGGGLNTLPNDHQGFRRQVIEQAISVIKKQWQVLFQTLRVQTLSQILVKGDLAGINHETVTKCPAKGFKRFRITWVLARRQHIEVCQTDR